MELTNRATILAAVALVARDVEAALEEQARALSISAKGWVELRAVVRDGFQALADTVAELTTDEAQGPTH